MKLLVVCLLDTFTTYENFSNKHTASYGIIALHYLNYILKIVIVTKII